MIIGRCALCGGDVVGFRGVWHSIMPAPEDHCVQCGAIRKQQDDTIIEMTPSKGYKRYRLSARATTEMTDVDAFYRT